MTISELKNLVEKENDINKLESLKAILEAVTWFRDLIQNHHCEINGFTLLNTEEGGTIWLLYITSPLTLSPELITSLIYDIIDGDENQGYASNITLDDHTLIITYGIG